MNVRERERTVFVFGNPQRKGKERKLRKEKGFCFFSWINNTTPYNLQVTPLVFVIPSSSTSFVCSHHNQSTIPISTNIHLYLLIHYGLYFSTTELGCRIRLKWHRVGSLHGHERERHDTTRYCVCWVVS